jgi:hypothetical protein
MSLSIRQIMPNDVALMESLLAGWHRGLAPVLNPGRAFVRWAVARQ